MRLLRWNIRRHKIVLNCMFTMYVVCLLYKDQELVIIPQRKSGSGTVIIPSRKSGSRTCLEEIRSRNLLSSLRGHQDQEPLSSVRENQYQWLIIFSQRKSGSGTCYFLSEEITIRNLSSFLRRNQDQERVIIP